MSLNPAHPVLAVAGVSKQYGALRPLRIQDLRVQADEAVALVGLDQVAAQVFINLITGASLPDAGTILVNGRPTSQIADGTEWLGSLDLFGIVSDRSTLLGDWSIIQNLAMPFSLDVEPPSEDLRQRATRLARDVEIPEGLWERPVRDLGALDQLRVRLARALALEPSVLILEHPSAALVRADVAPAARSIRAVARRRASAVIALTMDEEFAAAVSDRWLKLEPATGRLAQGRLGRMRFWS